MDGDGAPVFNSSLTDMFRARKDLLSDPALIDWELIFNWSVVGPSILLRKEVFYHPPAGIGLYDESLFFEDRDFYLRLLAAQALGFIDVKVAKYRKSNAGTSFNSSNDNPMALHWRQSNKKNASRFSGIKRLKLEIIGREQNYRKVFIYRKLNQLLNLCFKFVRFIKSLH
jgi:hypothetical protein